MGFIWAANSDPPRTVSTFPSVSSIPTPSRITKRVGLTQRRSIVPLSGGLTHVARRPQASLVPMFLLLAALASLGYELRASVASVVGGEGARRVLVMGRAVVGPLASRLYGGIRHQGKPPLAIPQYYPEVRQNWRKYLPLVPLPS